MSEISSTETAPDERCPHTGRTARWCTDQTHLACGAFQAQMATFDRKWEHAL